jgi:hypothetical protein
MTFCSIAGAAVSDPASQPATTSDGSQRLQTLRIVEARSSEHSPPKVPAKKTKIVQRSVIRRQLSVAHNPSASAREVAKVNDNATAMTEQTGKLTVSAPVSADFASRKGAPNLTTAGAPGETNQGNAARREIFVQNAVFVETKQDDRSTKKAKSTVSLLAAVSGGAILASGLGFVLVGFRRRSRIRLTSADDAL